MGVREVPIENLGQEINDEREQRYLAQSSGIACLPALEMSYGVVGLKH